MENSNFERIFGLYGVGGFGREVMPKLLEQRGATFDSINFIETNPTKNFYGDIPVISEEEFLKFKAQKFFNIAIADSQIRKVISERMLNSGAEPESIIATGSKVYKNSSIGPGAIVMDFSTITENVKIGRFFHLNIYSYVAHDCEIGDYVTFAPNVSCNGNTIIGDDVYVGTGAIIRPGTSSSPRRIGAGSVIGMGAVVTKDVPPYSTVVGNPARALLKETSTPKDVS